MRTHQCLSEYLRIKKLINMREHCMSAKNGHNLLSPPCSTHTKADHPYRKSCYDPLHYVGMTLIMFTPISFNVHGDCFAK